MTQLGYAVLGLALGVALGAVAVAAWRRRTPIASERLEARLEVQSAELRRLADAAATREGSAESVRVDLAGARRALESLAVREEERRGREREHGEGGRRLSVVLARGPPQGRAGGDGPPPHPARRSPPPPA